MIYASHCGCIEPTWKYIHVLIWGVLKKEWPEKWDYTYFFLCCLCCCCIASVVSYSVRLHGLQPTRLLHPWDLPGKSTGEGCCCLLHCCLCNILKQKWVYIYFLESSFHIVFLLLPESMAAESVINTRTPKTLYAYNPVCYKNRTGRNNLLIATLRLHSIWKTPVHVTPLLSTFPWSWWHNGEGPDGSLSPSVLYIRP